MPEGLRGPAVPADHEELLGQGLGVVPAARALRRVSPLHRVPHPPRLPQRRPPLQRPHSSAGAGGEADIRLHLFGTGPRQSQVGTREGLYWLAGLLADLGHGHPVKSSQLKSLPGGAPDKRLSLVDIDLKFCA